MQFFGITIARTKALAGVPVRGSSSFLGWIRESFPGAWQRNIECESQQNILAFSAVYSCVSLIADDIAKLRLKLMRMVTPELWTEITSGSTAFLPVLRKPNRYQTRIQFLSQWIVSKLLYGNTYVLLERDGRGVVAAMYVLDPRLVLPLVASDGSIFYQLKPDSLSSLEQGLTVPASEIIHDRMSSFWHPLVGVSPIYACGASATQGIRIQNNSAKFFENMSRPSGHLTTTGVISDATANRLKEQFEKGFSGGNIGRLLVTGDGLKYEPMTIPPDSAQLIEQLRWTVEDVARCFHVPLHKLGMGQPTLNNIAALNQDYYSQTLQTLIESIELLLDEALGLPSLGYGVEVDLEALMRMDPLSRADRAEKLIKAGILAPNEGRAGENLEPVEGGNSPMIQQQQYSLAALAKRDAKPDPFGGAAPTPPPNVAPPVLPPSPAKSTDSDAARRFVRALEAKFVTDHGV